MSQGQQLQSVVTGEPQRKPFQGFSRPLEALACVGSHAAGTPGVSLPMMEVQGASGIPKSSACGTTIAVGCAIPAHLGEVISIPWSRRARHAMRLVLRFMARSSHVVQDHIHHHLHTCKRTFKTAWNWQAPASRQPATAALSSSGVPLRECKAADTGW